MPTTAPPGRGGATAPTPLTAQEREVLRALGCGLGDAEIAQVLSLPEPLVARTLGQVLLKLGLPDRTAAVVHAFDSGLVLPGRGPRSAALTPPAAFRAPGPRLRISLLGPLLVSLAGQPVDVGPLRQQAVLAALALSPDRTVSRQRLLDDVWGTGSPDGNIVPVYVYRLRKSLRLAGCPEPVIRRDRHGYGLARGAADVDVAVAQDLAAAAGAAGRAGDLPEVVRLNTRALQLFRGEPLAGLPGPAAETERLRLGAFRVALARRKADAQLRLGRTADAVAGLSALARQEPLDEPVAVLLLHALRLAGRPAEALAVFERVRRRLAEDLGVTPGEPLLRARRAVLCGNGNGTGTGGERAGAA